MSEVIEHQDNLPTIEPATQVTSMFQVLERAATNPEVDVEKMERIYQMVERAEDRQAAQAYAQAMNQAQKKMPVVLRKSDNDQTKSRYAKHEHIVEQAGPIWLEEGFSLSFSEGVATNPEQVRIACQVMHSQGHSTEHHIDFDLDDRGIKGSPNKTQVHAKSSSMTYGQRILTCKIFNIPTADDLDGNGPVAQAIAYISEEDVLKVEAFIDENGLDKSAVLKWMGTKDVNSIEEIPNDGSLDLVMNRLRKMRGNS